MDAMRTTDKLGLPLYDYPQPADLTKQYNTSMQILDSTVHSLQSECEDARPGTQWFRIASYADIEQVLPDMQVGDYVVTDDTSDVYRLMYDLSKDSVTFAGDAKLKYNLHGNEFTDYAYDTSALQPADTYEGKADGAYTSTTPCSAMVLATDGNDVQVPFAPGQQANTDAICIWLSSEAEGEDIADNVEVACYYKLGGKLQHTSFVEVSSTRTDETKQLQGHATIALPKDAELASICLHTFGTGTQNAIMLSNPMDWSNAQYMLANKLSVAFHEANSNMVPYIQCEHDNGLEHVATLQGTPGRDGASGIVFGEGKPEAVPEGAMEGDIYVDKQTKDVYKVVGGKYEKAIALYDGAWEFHDGAPQFADVRQDGTLWCDTSTGNVWKAEYKVAPADFSATDTELTYKGEVIATKQNLVTGGTGSGSDETLVDEPPYVGASNGKYYRLHEPITLQPGDKLTLFSEYKLGTEYYYDDFDAETEHDDVLGDVVVVYNMSDEAKQLVRVPISSGEGYSNWPMLYPIIALRGWDTMKQYGIHQFSANEIIGYPNFVQVAQLLDALQYNANVIRPLHVSNPPSITSDYGYGYIVEVQASDRMVAIGSGASIESNDDPNSIAIGKAHVDRGGIAIGVGSAKQELDNGAWSKSGIAIGRDSYASGDARAGLVATAIGDGATAGTCSVAIGQKATCGSTASNYAHGIAIGYNATSHPDSTSYANNGIGGIAMGMNSNANERSIAIGQNAEASYSGISIGHNSKSVTSSLAIRADAPATRCVNICGGTLNNPQNVQYSTMVGYAAYANENGVAIGYNASTFSPNSVAVGSSSLVDRNCSNSVALGQGSKASESNTVSIGRTTTNSSGQVVSETTRRIVHVGTPVNASDAATKQYVDNAIQTLTTQLSTLTEQVQALTTRIAAIEQSYMPRNPQASEFEPETE